MVNTIAEKTGIPKVDILLTLETLFTSIKTNIVRGESVFIRGFGTFAQKKRAAKIGRNVKKNTAVHIPAHSIPSFKPAKEFVAAVKKQASNGAISQHDK